MSYTAYTTMTGVILSVDESLGLVDIDFEEHGAHPCGLHDLEVLPQVREHLGRRVDAYVEVHRAYESDAIENVFIISLELAPERAPSPHGLLDALGALVGDDLDGFDVDAFIAEHRGD